MARDPSFTIDYGDLKCGKSFRALACFPTAAYVAAPGALAPAEEVGFEQPKAHDLPHFTAVRKFAEALPAGTVALVVDDATLLADRTAIYYRDEKHLGGYDLWGAVLNAGIKMRDALRRKGIHLVFTCHPVGAEVKEGVRHRGGPSFQGQCRGKIPAAADLLLRAEERPGPGFGWPFVYRTAPHPDWLQGSRYSTPDMVPTNLGEVLRAAGFVIPRLRGLEWQDKVANTVANKILADGLADQEKTGAALKQAFDYCMSKLTKNEKHAQWAIRDGYDRAIIHFAKQEQRKGLWGF